MVSNGLKILLVKEQCRLIITEQQSKYMYNEYIHCIMACTAQICITYWYI